MSELRNQEESSNQNINQGMRQESRIQNDICRNEIDGTCPLDVVIDKGGGEISEHLQSNYTDAFAFHGPYKSQIDASSLEPMHALVEWIYPCSNDEEAPNQEVQPENIEPCAPVIHVIEAINITVIKNPEEQSLIVKFFSGSAYIIMVLLLLGIMGILLALLARTILGR